MREPQNAKLKKALSDLLEILDDKCPAAVWARNLLSDIPDCYHPSIKMERGSDRSFFIQCTCCGKSGPKALKYREAKNAFANKGIIE